jgi:hypothetical protein
MSSKMFNVVLVLAGLVALKGSASAAPRYQEVEALPIYRRTFTLPPGQHTFSTSDLQTGSMPWGCASPDTIMVVATTFGPASANDNCSATTKGSCVIVTGPVQAVYTVTVFAAPPAGGIKKCGTADVSIDGALQSADVPFGGSLVQPGLSGTMDVNLISPPSGALETMLVAYDNSWQELAFSIDSVSSEIGARAPVALTTTTKLLVGSTNAASIGLTAVIINDCLYQPEENPSAPTWCQDQGKDTDNDSVSNALEAELQTNNTFHDTDRDGIFDYYEIFGRKTTGVVPLKFLGANPRRRDLFVEFDREQIDINNPPTPGAILPGPADAKCPAPSTGSPLRNRQPIGMEGWYGDTITYMRDVFLDMPSLPPNPDGTRFIQVHVDAGRACPLAPSLCGDWGGSQLVRGNDEYYKNEALVAANFARVRRGVFKYIFLQCGGNGNGQAGVSARADAVNKATHELGHTFGLEHWGKLPAGFHAANERTYPSTMNYLWSYAFPQWSPQLPRGRWSEGKLSQLDTPVESGFLATVFAPHLDNSPFSFPVQGNSLDVNRDGRISTTSVLTDTSPLMVEANREWPNIVGRSALPSPCSPPGNCPPTGAAGFAVRPVNATVSKLYAYVPRSHADGCYPDVSVSAFTSGVATAWGTSFSNGVPFAGNCTGEASARSVSATSGRVLLLFPDSAGILNYRYFDPDSATTTPWRPIPNWPTGVRARSASIGEPSAAMGGMYPVVWTDTSNLGASPLVPANVWEAWFSPLDPDQSTWTTPQLTNVGSVATPGIALGPDSSLYIAASQWDSTGSDTAIHLLRRVGPWTWTEPVPVSLPALQRLPTTPLSELDVTRLSLVSMPLRTGDGGKFADNSHQFGVFWGTWENDPVDWDGKWHRRRAYQNGYISPTAFNLTGWSSRFDEFIARPMYQHSVVASSRLLDVSVLFNGRDDSNTIFLPTASGTLVNYHGHVDTDDAKVISDAMCSTLWMWERGADAECYCNTRALCTDPALRLPTPSEPLDRCPGDP